jgi:hypothetical protein
MRLFQNTVHLVLILALFAATGGHWMVLQSVAWSAMLVQYSRGASLASAVEQTFDGKHPCALCEKIARGRHDEKKPDARVVSDKLKFCYQPAASPLLSPGNFWQMHPGDAFSPALSDQPLVPPPRLLPG